METIESADGTRIAFSRSGKGPPLVLVHGSTADHTRWTNVLSVLEADFTVFAMDRRGRGMSGDSEGYALEKEFDDVAAVVRTAGSDVNLLGHSFGALCALEAALRVENLRRVILYEPAFPVGSAPLYPPGLLDHLDATLEKSGPEEFLIAFFKEAAGATEDQIDALRADPSWSGRIAAAHTALREMADGDYQFQADRFQNLKVPFMLLVGGDSPVELTAPSAVIDAALSDSYVHTLTGQQHVAMTTAPKMFLDAVNGFLRV